MSIFTPLIIISILLLNYYIFKRNSYSKSFFLLSSSFLIIYTLFSIVIYYNNLSNGFEHGILFGNVANNHFCDEYKYYIDSDILLNHLKNGDISAWLNKELPVYEFIDPEGHASYGNYNMFVILLTLLKAIGIKSALDLILIKLFVYIPTSIFLYKISKLYLNEKLSLISVGVFSLLPGYILCNSLLMRDNLIIMITIIFLYYILSKSFTWKSSIFLFILAIILFQLRAYLILILMSTVIFTFKNSKHLISIKDIIYLIIILFAIYFIINFNFNGSHSNILFSYSQIKQLQDTFKATFGIGANMFINLFYQTFIHIFFDPFFLNFLSSSLIYLILLSLGNIIGTMISIAFLIKFLILCFKNKNDNLTSLLKFTAYFTLLTALLVMSKDTFIINRIALIWLPLFIIILLYSIDLISRKN